jgi:hypothetical protein
MTHAASGAPTARESGSTVVLVIGPTKLAPVIVSWQQP